MSRIGKRAVEIPKEAKVKFENGTLFAEGPKGKLHIPVPSELKITISEGVLTVTRSEDTKRLRELHGLVRNLAKNIIIGVAKGYTKKLDIHGVGFKAQMKGKSINLNLGYSHDITYPVPAGATVTVPQPTVVVVESADKALCGQVAAKIRDFFRPEPYKGKGVRYSDEQIRRKQGKVVG